jgi:hypothetical protein
MSQSKATPMNGHWRGISTMLPIWVTGLLFLLIAFPFGTASAQKSAARVVGKITDASTNEALGGVSVTVKNGQKGVSSAADGTYNLVLPPGTYTLVYSSSGYQGKEISGVEVKDGETTFQNIILVAAKAEMQGIVITSARKESQASVYSVQKRSAAASDGISIESIQKTPDNNAGQITRRITGVSVSPDNRFVVVRGLADQYNQTILNGVPMASTETDRNAFAMDLIPAAVIDNIVVNKTATPDMPGNFAGGLVQVNTLDFPTSRFISLSVQGSAYDLTYGKPYYSDKRGSTEWLGFSSPSRELPSGFPAFKDQASIVQQNIQEKTRFLRTLPNNLATFSQGDSWLNHSVQLGFGNSYRLKNGSQFGLVFAVNQRTNELIESEVTAAQPVGPGVGVAQEGFKFLNYYSENIRYTFSSGIGGALNLSFRKGNHKISLKNLYSNQFRNIYIDRPFASIEAFAVLGPVPGVSRISGTSHVVESRQILSNALSGEHRTGRNNETRIDWNVNTAFYNTFLPDTRNFIYKKTDSSGFLLGNSNSSVAQAISSQGRSWSDNQDFIYGGAFNLSSVFTVGGKKQLLKGGFLFQNRSRNASGILIPYFAPEGTIEEFLDPVNVYPGGPLEFTTAISGVASQVGNYNAGSSTLAVYESMENNLFKGMRLIWGLRVENYHQFVNVFDPVFFAGFDEPVLQPSGYTSRNAFNFLPSLNFVYALNEKVNLRAGISSTVIRPELKDLAPFLSFDFRNFQTTTGNTELRSTSILNYDLKLEYFPSSGEIISIAGFYKDITDPIEKVQGVDNDIAIQPLNTGKAYVFGAEAELRKRLDFFKGAEWMSNVFLFGNASLIRSKVEAGPLDNIRVREVIEHPLSGQPEYIINAGISVQLFKKSMEATFSFNTTSDYIVQLGTFNKVILPNGNITQTSPHFIFKGRDMADFVITQSVLKKRGKIKFSVSNLFREPLVIYQDLNGNGRFDQLVTIDKAAFDYTITGGEDNSPVNVIGQRNISLSFSYTFK